MGCLDGIEKLPSLPFPSGFLPHGEAADDDRFPHFGDGKPDKCLTVRGPADVRRRDHGDLLGRVDGRQLFVEVAQIREVIGSWGLLENRGGAWRSRVSLESK